MSNHIDALNGNHDNGIEVTAPRMKKYVGKLYERNGEYEYWHPVLFETEADPMSELTKLAREFYPDEADPQEDGFSFYAGGIYVAPESADEVTDEEYAVLKRFI